MKRKLLSLLMVLAMSFVFAACNSSSSISTTKDLVAKFQAADLQVNNPRVMETTHFGIAPKLTEDAMIFTVDVTNERNARVFKFNNTEDLNKLKAFYDDLGKTSALFYSYTYAKGLFLIQANGEIPKAEFDKYVKVMDDNIK